MDDIICGKELPKIIPIIKTIIDTIITIGIHFLIIWSLSNFTTTLNANTNDIKRNAPENKYQYLKICKS